jgi:hypothetical protein
MDKKKPIPEDVVAELRQRAEEDRQKLIVQIVKLPNGATFTRLKPVGVG